MRDIEFENRLVFAMLQGLCGIKPPPPEREELLELANKLQEKYGPSEYRNWFDAVHHYQYGDKSNWPEDPKHADVLVAREWLKNGPPQGYIEVIEDEAQT